MAEKKSKEKKQEELVRKQGDAFVTSINFHVEELVHTVKRIDDYIVTVAFELAEGSYQMQSDNSLDWENPEGYGSLHAEIIVQDRDDKRFVPYLDIKAKIYDKDNNLVTESDAPFMWHHHIFHYGFDTLIPDEGEYTVEVTIKKPKFNRHKKDHGKRYTEDVMTKIGPIHLFPPAGDSEDDILNS